MKHHVLVIDDDADIRKSMTDFLEDEGFYIRAVGTGDEAIALVRQGIVTFSTALVDVHMPEMDGRKVIRELKRFCPKLTVLGFSGDDSTEAHNETLDSGADFFVLKDTADAKLLGILHRVCRDVEKLTKPLVLPEPSENQKLIASAGMVGVSDALVQVVRLIHSFAPSKEAVLIRGEHGTGKELVARAVHQASTRARGPFIAVNCAAIPTNLIESELFGHAKGSFTGANQARIGHFQAADGGTIFLDEIGELPSALQATLLRVLQEKTITPVGSSSTKRIDFRLVAATNANLERMIEEKTFREDLFFRLNVLPIPLKPLRERPEDIPYLAEVFLERANREHKTKKILLQSSAAELMRRSWRGNVRELEHCISRLVSLSPGNVLDLSILGSAQIEDAKPMKVLDLSDIRYSRDRDEKSLIISALKRAGSAAGAARILKLSRSTLRDKMKKHGIQVQKSNPEDLSHE